MPNRYVDESTTCAVQYCISLHAGNERNSVSNETVSLQIQPHVFANKQLWNDGAALQKKLARLSDQILGKNSWQCSWQEHRWEFLPRSCRQFSAIILSKPKPLVRTARVGNCKNLGKTAWVLGKIWEDLAKNKNRGENLTRFWDWNNRDKTAWVLGKIVVKSWKDLARFDNYV